MGENFLWLMDRQLPGTRAIVWQADFHICIDNPWGVRPHLGSLLRERYGERYYAFGLEFGGGSFLTRTALPDGRLGGVRVITLPPAPAGTLPWYMSQVSPGASLLDLRAPVDDAVVVEWLHLPQLVYNSGWIPDEDVTFCDERHMTRMFDGIVFVNTTTPIRQTENARRVIAAREGL